MRKNWQTPLRVAMDDKALSLLARHCNKVSDSHFSALRGWRKDMARFEKRMEDSMLDRASTHHRENNGPLDNSSLRSIFEKSNETMNLVGGFADFAFSQAKNDLFGASPFFATRPVGVDDKEKSDLINAHSNWKLGGSNIQAGMEEALELAFHLGTSFPKAIWRRSEESYERMATILVDAEGNGITGEDGEYFYIEDEEGGDEEEKQYPEEAVGYAEMMIEERELYFDNVEVECVDFRDIAWDPTAKQFDLEHTPVFHRVRPRLLDLAAELDLSREQVDNLRTNAVRDQSEGLDDKSGGDARDHRREETPSLTRETAEDSLTNPEVTVIECFLRIDALRNGRPVRIFAIYVPAINEVIYVDYLANVTPKGALPINPVRVYKIPGRVYGRGFHEKYENVQNYIDANFNAATYLNTQTRATPMGYDETQLDEDIEVQEGNIPVSFDKVWKLKAGATMKEAFQFGDAPPDTDKSIELASVMIEMAQLRTGISSAAQGEVSSVGGTNTATGIRQMMSRSATLMRWPIDKAQKDLQKTLSYAVTMIYANQNRAEVFSWGEGQNAQVLTMTPEEVRDIQVDVNFMMVQAQNQTKLENAQTAIQTLQSYVNLPEFEKGPARELFIQAIQSVDFHDPASIVREPVLSYDQLLAQLPPELAQMLVQNSQPHAEQIAAQEEGNQQ